MNLWDFLAYALLFAAVLLFSGGAVWALAWAFRNGQFDNFQRGARSIFDPDEPIGEPTDYFPGQTPRRPHRPPTKAEPSKNGHQHG